MSADFSPTLGTYSGQGAFRYWCQQVLPLTFDDSISYMELLAKVVKYLNNMREDVATAESNIDALNVAFNALQDYVNAYFDDLNVDNAISIKLDRMAQDGSLGVVVDPIVRDEVADEISGVVANQIGDAVAGQIDDVVAEQIDASVGRQIDDSVAEQLAAVVATQISAVVAAQIDDAVAGQIDNAVAGQIGGAVAGEVTDWLTDHVTPVGSAVVVDDSLLVSGAAADSKTVGDLLFPSVDALNLNGLMSIKWEQGTINTGDGSEVSSSSRIRSEYIRTPLTISVEDGYKYNIIYFNASYVVTGNTGWLTNNNHLSNENSTWCRIVLAEADDADIDTTYASNITINTNRVLEYNGIITSGAFADYNKTGYYGFHSSSLASISDAPSDLNMGGMLFVFASNATVSIYQIIVSSDYSIWLRHNNNPFVRKTNDTTLSISAASPDSKTVGDLLFPVVKSMLDNGLNDITWEMGTVDPSTGSIISSNIRITSSFIKTPITINVGAGTKYKISYYDDSYTLRSYTEYITNDHHLSDEAYPYCRVIIGASDDSIITTSYSSNISIYKNILFSYNGIITSGAFVNCVKHGYYVFNSSSLSNISDAPSDLQTGGIIITLPSNATRVIYQIIIGSDFNIWFGYGGTFNHVFNGVYGYMYRGRITSGTFAENNRPGYYAFSATVISDITDRPTDLSTGGILRVEQPASGGVVYQTIVDNYGNMWFRYGGNAFVNYKNIFHDRSVNWYALGDSITAGYYSANGDIGGVTSDNYVTNVAKLNGYTFTNYAVGGSGYLHNATVGDGLNARGKVDTINFANCDLVTLAFGINDWHYNMAIGDVTDTVAQADTMCSNMKYCIEKILTDNPYCKIIVLTPMNCSKYGGTFDTNWGLGYALSTAGTLQNVVDKIIAICEYYGVEYIDQSSTSIVNRKNIQTVLNDGIHPTLTLYPKLGKDLASKINMK